MTNKNKNDDSNGDLTMDQSSFGDEINKSFRSLRRLMGMEADDDEQDEGDQGGNSNNDISFATAANPRRPSVTFTSLRKLVDERASFCLPSAHKMRRSTAAKSKKTSRGVYDDSDHEDDDDDIDISPNYLFADADPPLSPSLALATARSELHHPQEYLAISKKQQKQGKGKNVQTPPVSPILFSPDSATKSTAEVSRSILPELEQSAKQAPIKVETVGSDDEDDDDDDSQVKEQSPPATPVEKAAATTVPRRSRLMVALWVLFAFITLLVGGFFGRLYQMDKLDNFVTQVQGGNMDSKQFKTVMVEVTGTQDVDFNQQYADIESKVKDTYAAKQEQLQQTVDDTLKKLEVWQLQIQGTLFTYNEKIGNAWDSKIADIKHTVDLVKTVNSTIALNMLSELSNTTWEKVEIGMTNLKEMVPSSEELSSTVTSTIGEENIERFNRKVAEMEIVLVQLHSNLTKVCSEMGSELRSKLPSALGPEKMALIQQTWLELQGNMSLYLEESALKDYLQSYNATLYALREQLFGKGEIASDVASSEPVEDQDTSDLEAVEEEDVAPETEDLTNADDEEQAVPDDVPVDETPVLVEDVPLEEAEEVIEMSSEKGDSEDSIVTESVTVQLEEDHAKEFVEEEVEVRDVDEPETTEQQSTMVEEDVATDDEDIDTTEKDPSAEAEQVEYEDALVSDDGDVEETVENDVEEIEMVSQDGAVVLDAANEDTADDVEEKVVVEETPVADAAMSEGEAVSADSSSTEAEGTDPETKDAAATRASKPKRKPLRKIRRALENLFGKQSDEDIQDEQELAKMKADLDGMLQDVNRSDTGISDEDIAELTKEAEPLHKDHKPLGRVKAKFGRVFRKKKTESEAAAN